MLDAILGCAVVAFIAMPFVAIAYEDVRKGEK